MTGRIQVLGMRTWGEFGNILAATRLARVIEAQHPDCVVELYEAEEFFPRFEEIGAEIRALTVESPDAATRARRYLALMSRLAAEFPQGFEAGDPRALTFVSALESLAGHFRRTRPDVVVGTKGVISRVAQSALRLAGHPARMANFVTNQGLLTLEIHRAVHALNLVGFPAARDYLVGGLGFAPERVRVVGPMIAAHELKEFLVGPDDARSGDESAWGGDDERPAIIVFSNRGGDEYLALVRHLAVRHPGVDLVFVSYNDRGLLAAAAAVPERPARWRFHNRLSQPEYFAYIHGAARSRNGLLISKAGPNTTLEASWFGIPVLSLRSGLPMEDWVGGLIREHGVGRCCAEMGELVATLDAWLADGSVLPALKANALTFAAGALDQAAVARNVGEAIGALLPRAAAELLFQPA